MFNQNLNLLYEPQNWCPPRNLPQHYMNCTAGTLSNPMLVHQGGFTFSEEETKSRNMIITLFVINIMQEWKWCVGINVKCSVSCMIISKESSKMVVMPKSSSLHSIRQVTYSDYLWMDRNGHPVPPPPSQEKHKHCLTYVSGFLVQVVATTVVLWRLF